VSVAEEIEKDASAVFLGVVVGKRREEKRREEKRREEKRREEKRRGWHWCALYQRDGRHTLR
jgi:hypothetical protein